MQKQGLLKPAKRKPPRWLFLSLLPCLGLYVLAAACSNLYSLLLVPDFTETASIDIEGLAPENWDTVGVTLVPLKEDPFILDSGAARLDKTYHWIAYKRWFKTFRVHATESSLSHIKLIHVQIGATSQNFGREEINNLKRVEPEPWAIGTSGQAVASLELPPQAANGVSNSPPIEQLLLHAAAPGATIALVAALVIVFTWCIGDRPYFQNLLNISLSKAKHDPLE